MSSNGRKGSYNLEASYKPYQRMTKRAAKILLALGATFPLKERILELF